MAWAIETENLGMSFRTNWGSKKRALDGLTMQVAENEIFGFLGHNGAGKTTTIKILIGLCHASEGQAQIGGVPITQVHARNKVGFLPENISFHEYLTGLETIEFYARLHGVPEQESKKRAPAMLEDVGLKDAMQRRVREYSKGMRQRLGLAQAMVHDPQIFILDEPFTGLDPVGRREIREKICRLKEQGKTIFFSSHILSDVELLCDRVALLSHGKLIAIGTLDALLDPKIVSVEVVGEGFTAEAIARIQTFCVRIVSEGKRCAVLVRTEQDAQQVKQLLESGGGILKALMPQRESLEDFYMRQVSRQGEKA